MITGEQAGHRYLVRPSSLIALVVLLLAGGSLRAQSEPDGPEASARARITVERHTKVYRRASRNTAVLGYALSSVRYPLLQRSEGWCRIDFHGTPGWINENEAAGVRVLDITPGQPPDAGTTSTPSPPPSRTGARTIVTVKGNFAEVRTSPDPDSKPIAFALSGEKFLVVKRRGTWVGIPFKNTIGWIRERDLSRLPSRTETPEKSPSPASTTSTASRSSSVRTPTPPRPRPTQTPPPSRTPVQRDRSLLSRLLGTQERDEQVEDSTWLHPSARLLGDETDTPTVRNDSMPALPVEEENRDLLFVVVLDTADVHRFLSTSSPVLGVAFRGERYRLVAAGKTWCKIVFGDTLGWIRREEVGIPGQQRREGPIAELLRSPRLLIASTAVVLTGLLAALIIALVGALRKRKAKRRARTSSSKTCLLVAHTPKRVEYAFSSTRVSLEKCFTEIGFDVTTATQIEVARNILTHYVPDVICVDWEFSRDVQGELERMLTDKVTTANSFVIFYNVPDPPTVARSSIILNASYLGFSVSDRDIFKLVTPLVITGRKTKIIRKSVEAHALEGDIGPESLLEILQFIEIGKKTGCLLVDRESPFGMLYFDEGEIVFAAAPGLSGKQAVWRMLDLNRGKFRFVAGRLPNSRNITEGTLAILMQWSKERDEASRY